jgi:hypothetical protein
LLGGKLKAFCMAHGNSISRGVTHLIKELISIDVNAAIDGAYRAGLGCMHGRLNVTESAALMTMISLTGRQYLTLNAFLYRKTGFHLLAPLPKINALAEKDAAELIFGEVLIPAKPGEKEKLLEFYTVKNWMGEVVKLITKQIKENEGRSFGYELVNKERKVFVSLSMDGGNLSVKAGISVLCYRDAANSQNNFVKVAELFAKENRANLDLTIAPRMVEEIADIEAHQVLILKDETGGFVCIKVVKKNFDATEFEKALPEGAMTYDKFDVDVLLVGDLCLFATLLGKEGMSGSWCPWCNVELGKLKEKAGVGEAWTLNRLEEAKCEFDRRKAGGKSKSLNGVTGVHSSVMFAGIEVSNCAIPVLHIELGIPIKLLQAFLLWVFYHVEIDLTPKQR